MAASLKDYLWMKRFGYKSCPREEDIGWTTMKTHGIIRAPIKALRASIVTERGHVRMTIERTPHFKWIESLVSGPENTQARREYHHYLDRYMPDCDADAAVAHMVHFVKTMRAEGHEDGTITVISGRPKRQLHIGPYYLKIYDGVHRTSIALAMGHRYVQCRIRS